MLTQEKATTIRSDLDIVTARSLARDVAKQMGFSSVDQARIATAVSELARNIFVYAGTGQVQVRSVERNGRTGIEMEFTDQGPGISDIDTVMQDGYSTVKSMGMGLPGARRLMDEFDIHSQVGVGTTVVCRKWKR
jgi:serine/threonine-protein kinase RsbT